MLNKIIRVLRSTPAILAIIFFSLGWYLIGLDLEILLNILSVAAITMSQLILADSCRDTAAMQKKLDELIYSSDADDRVAKIEKK